MREVDLDMLRDMSDKEVRSISNIVQLLIWESFGTKSESKTAHIILTSLREKYPVK